jgi:hypothetical protein
MAAAAISAHEYSDVFIRYNLKRFVTQSSDLISKSLDLYFSLIKRHIFYVVILREGGIHHVQQIFNAISCSFLGTQKL